MAARSIRPWKPSRKRIVNNFQKMLARLTQNSPNTSAESVCIRRFWHFGLEVRWEPRAIHQCHSTEESLSGERIRQVAVKVSRCYLRAFVVPNEGDSVLNGREKPLVSATAPLNARGEDRSIGICEPKGMNHGRRTLDS